jgi:hypothetical protein
MREHEGHEGREEQEGHEWHEEHEGFEGKSLGKTSCRHAAPEGVRE